MFYSDADQIRQYYSEYAHKQGYVGKYIKLKHELTSGIPMDSLMPENADTSSKTMHIYISTWNGSRR